MNLRMTKAEREGFLAGVHVGVLAIPTEGRGPLTIPIWYAYEPGGELRIVTDRTSRKGKLITVGTHLSLCAQTESLPYKYVTVEGPVTAIEPADLERDIRPLAHRYLGQQLGDQYVKETAPERERGDSVLIRVDPARWLSVDYEKQFGSV